MKRKSFIILLVVSAVIFATAAGLLVSELLLPGASGPKKALQSYIEATLLYDVQGMIKYSSEYNKYNLYGNRYLGSDTSLSEYLEKSYGSIDSGYKGKTVEILILSEERVTYEVLTMLENLYTTRSDGNERKYPDAQEFLAIRFSVNADETYQYSASAYVVKTEGRWYYLSQANTPLY